MYNLEAKRVAEEIQRHEASKVLIQLPEGLRPTAFALLRDLKKQTDAMIILSGDSCYGACDLATTQARAVNADMIVHYGHSKMIEAEIPVVYVNASYDFDVQKLMRKALPLIEEWKGIGLTTTIQHVHRLPEVSLFLEEKGLKPFIGIVNTINPGQITGCNYDAATKIVSKVQGYLFVGAGKFHPIGLAATTGKIIAIANPYTFNAEYLDQHQITRLAMKRMAAIANAKKAKTIAILMSSKPGQLNISGTEILLQKIIQSGKDAAIIVLDEITSHKLRDFSEVQAFIVAACPRIAFDGLPDEDRPVITTTESLVLLDEKRWEDVWGQKYFEIFS